MPGTTRTLLTLMRRLALPAEELERLQLRLLQGVIRHAYHHVPYYEQLFDSAGVRPDDVRTLADLRNIPISDKIALRAAGLSATLARGADPASCHVEKTSGTSGRILAIYLTQQERQLRRLVRLRAFAIAGRRPREVLCTMGPPAPGGWNWYHLLGLYRTRYVSEFLPLAEQIRQLQRARPNLIKAWPSALRPVLHELDYCLSRVARPRALITSSEPLDRSVAMRLKADLPLELFDFYVAAECGEIAAECPAHQGLHVHADQVLVEILRDDGSPAQPGEEGSVVVTSLHAFAMPFIRYRLNDRCAAIGVPCSCGISFPLIHPPRGRQDDMVRLPSGGYRAPGVLTNYVKDVDEVDQFRFTQERLDRIVLDLVLLREPDERSLCRLRERVLHYLGEPVELNIQIVKAIPPQRRKFRRFVSMIEDTL